MRFGELLAGSGPSDYYDFTPDEWLEWASASVVTDEDRQKASEAVMRAFLDRAKPTLTDEEREAIADAVDVFAESAIHIDNEADRRRAETLRGLLRRLS